MMGMEDRAMRPVGELLMAVPWVTPWPRSPAPGGRAVCEERPTQGWQVEGHWGSAIQGSSSAWP